MYTGFKRMTIDEETDRRLAILARNTKTSKAGFVRAMVNDHFSQLIEGEDKVKTRVVRIPKDDAVVTIKHGQAITYGELSFLLKLITLGGIALGINIDVRQLLGGFHENNEVPLDEVSQ